MGCRLLRAWLEFLEFLWFFLKLILVSIGLFFRLALLDLRRSPPPFNSFKAFKFRILSSQEVLRQQVWKQRLYPCPRRSRVWLVCLHPRQLDCQSYPSFIVWPLCRTLWKVPRVSSIDLVFSCCKWSSLCFIYIPEPIILYQFDLDFLSTHF